MAWAAPLAMIAPSHGWAQASSAERDFAIPAGPLAQALQSFSATTGIQLVYSSDLVAGMTTQGIQGRMEARAALLRLLTGTGLTGSFSGNTATIEGGTTADGERMTGVVRVEGLEGSPYYGGAGQSAGVNGTNGSRDISATEGTRSFTSGALSVGGKAAQAIKDVPQSVSVLTSERMAQQNITDYTSALQQMPGVTLVQGSVSGTTQFYSRGFEVTNIQVDGGVPFTTGSSNIQTTQTFFGSSGFFPQIDMAQYDHVEMLRGAANFNGFGSPSGSVNLTRKKPLDHAQFAVEGQVGSWQNYRLVADATAPLAFDGALRGRLVSVYQDQHYFYDTAKLNKTLLYGILEADVTPTTLVTAGGSYTRQNSTPWGSGLPRYLNGQDLHLPRSECLCFSWNRFDLSTLELFGSVEQKIGDDWKAKVNVTRIDQTSFMKIGNNLQSVDPFTNKGPRLTGVYDDFSSNQFSAEATINGAFMLFGQRQELTVGASRLKVDSSGRTNYNGLVAGNRASPYIPYSGGPSFFSGSPNGLTPPIDVFNFDPNDPLYNEPRKPLPSTRYNKNGYTQSIVYGNLRLTPLEKLHFDVTLRATWLDVEQDFDLLCSTASQCGSKPISTPFFNVNRSFQDNRVSWPPSGSVSYDITKALTAYVGYADVYESQAGQLDANLTPLKPRTGSNIEAGLKWAPADGRLNISLSAYRTRQKNLPTQVSSGGVQNCCYVADPNSRYESKGFDLEATGQIVNGWQISASFAYNENKQIGPFFGANSDTPFLSIQPKSLYKVWTSYSFGEAGHKGFLSGLTVSGGINGQSSAYRSGITCVNLVQVNGETTCKTFTAPDVVPFSFVIPSRVLFSGRVDYRLSDEWNVALNLENIFDKTYYQTVSSRVDFGHWYGAPRNFTLSLRGKW